MTRSTCHFFDDIYLSFLLWPAFLFRSIVMDCYFLVFLLFGKHSFSDHRQKSLLSVLHDRPRRQRLCSERWGSSSVEHLSFEHFFIVYFVYLAHFVCTLHFVHIYWFPCVQGGAINSRLLSILFTLFTVTMEVVCSPT